MLFLVLTTKAPFAMQRAGGWADVFFKGGREAYFCLVYRPARCIGNARGRKNRPPARYTVKGPLLFLS